MAGEYVLDESEYKVLETGEQRPITSEEVKRKLESPVPKVIEQEDFDRKDYTMLDYLSLEHGQYPRNFRDNKSKAVSTALGAGVAYGGSQLISDNPLTATGGIMGFALASYIIGLREQEMDLDEALENSRDHWSEKTL